MKRSVVTGCAALVALIFVSINSVSAQSLGAIEWLTDLTSAAKATRSQNRPLVLFLTMKGCTYCTKMKRQTYNDADVVSHISNSYVAAQLDGLKNQKLIRKIGVRVFPTTAIVSAEGRVMEVIHGYVDSRDLLKHLTLAKQKHAELVATAPATRTKK